MPDVNAPIENYWANRDRERMLQQQYDRAMQERAATAQQQMAMRMWLYQNSPYAKAALDKQQAAAATAKKKQDDETDTFRAFMSLKPTDVDPTWRPLLAAYQAHPPDISIIRRFMGSGYRPANLQLKTIPTEDKGRLTTTGVLFNPGSGGTSGAPIGALGPKPAPRGRAVSVTPPALSKPYDSGKGLVLPSIGPAATLPPDDEGLIGRYTH